MEGPSLVILKEEIQPFRGKVVSEAFGLAKLNYDQLNGKTIEDFQTWGKHFLVVFQAFSLRIHFLMFGSYRVNETKDRNPSLHLGFRDKSELNFYTCSIREIESPIDEVYDWASDIMSDRWDAGKAKRKLKSYAELNVGDALLDQEIFSGVGNIIKNEVLYRIGVHPDSNLGALPPRKLTALVKEARSYSFDFYRWKKNYELKKHWLVHTKKKCQQCSGPVIKKYTGKMNRRSFYCENCQELYSAQRH